MNGLVEPDSIYLVLERRSENDLRLRLQRAPGDMQFFRDVGDGVADREVSAHDCQDFCDESSLRCSLCSG